MPSFKCEYCDTKRITKTMMDEHVTAAHGGPKTVGDRQPVGERGEPTGLLKGMTMQMQRQMEERVAEVGDEGGDQMVRDQLLADRPRMNVRDQHMTWGGKALPSKVRVYDSDGYERFVPPDIALDRVAFKGWTWPREGESGHRTEGWWTSRPCRACKKVIHSNGKRGPEESIIQHEMKKHRAWWEAHQNDQASKAQTQIAEALALLAKREVPVDNAK